MDYQSITYDFEDSVATITLDSAPLNIINIAMMVELIDAIGRCANDKAQVLVFSGAGVKAFSAGVEIGEHTPGLVEKMLTTFHDIFRALVRVQQNSGLVTVAKVNGHCLGGGCELACICDFVITSEKSKFGVPEILLGCYPPVAAALFPSMIGRKVSEQLMISGEILRADRALEIGLATSVVSESELDAEVDSIIETIRSKSSAVLNLLRKSEPDWRSAFLSQLDVAEKIYLKELIELEDMQEGIDAYQQKRAPLWKHQ